MHKSEPARLRLTAALGQRRRLELLKAVNAHLKPRVNGLMIEDDESIDLLSQLAEKLGVSKRAALRHALESYERYLKTDTHDA